VHPPSLRRLAGLATTRGAAALLALGARLLTRESPLGCLADQNAVALRRVDCRWADRV
jgi:hypothetical protein